MIKVWIEVAFLWIWFVSLLGQDQPKYRPYNAWVTTTDNEIIQGVFYQVADSLLILVDPKAYEIPSPESVFFTPLSIHEVDQVKLRRKADPRKNFPGGGWVQPALISCVVGMTLGYIVGSIIGLEKQESSIWEPLEDHKYQNIGTVVGLGIGAGLGFGISAIKINIPIQGSYERYHRKKVKLQRYEYLDIPYAY